MSSAVADLTVDERTASVAELASLYRWRDRYAWMLREGAHARAWAANEAGIRRLENLLGKETA